MTRPITGSGLGIWASCKGASRCVRLEDVNSVSAKIRYHEVLVRRVCDRRVRVCATFISADVANFNACVTYEDCLELLGPGCEIVNLVLESSCELLDSWVLYTDMVPGSYSARAMNPLPNRPPYTSEPETLA